MSLGDEETRRRNGFARLKWRWLDMLMHDASLSPAERLVGYEIARRFNPKTGDAWPSQARMAADLAIDVKTIKRATAKLNGGGGAKRYIIVNREPASANSKAVRNRYVLRFDVLNEPAVVFFGDGDEGDLLPRSRGTDIPQGHYVPKDIHSNDGDKNGSSYGDKNGPVTSLIQISSETTALHDVIVSAPVAAVLTDVRWKNDLAARLSPSTVDAWFGSAKFDQVIDDEAIVVVPSKFIQSYIKSHFETVLIEALQRDHPAVRRVTLHVRTDGGGCGDV